MTDEQLDKVLAKIPTDKVYEDLFQPGLKKAGEALANVFDFGNLIMLPIKLVNEKSRIYLSHNLKKYEEKLSKIDDKELCAVSHQIGLPIIDKLLVVNQEELADAFINLLTKASTNKTQHLVHPAFLNILNNLSQDEAILLLAVKEYKRIPFIDIYIEKTTFLYPKPAHYDTSSPKSKAQLEEGVKYTEGIKNVFLKAAYNLTAIEKTMKLYFPENIDLYIENLERSGIISFERELFYEDDDKKYNDLINTHYKDIIEEYKTTLVENANASGNTTVKLDIRKCYIQFTDFGKAFINAVIKNVE